MNVLISRKDNLGDILCTMHLASLIKQSHNEAQVFFLVRDYAKGLILAAKEIDGFISYDKLNQSSLEEIKKTLHSFDVFIDASADKLSSYWAKKANIPLRIGNGHRLSGLLYANKRLHIKRKNSAKHETELSVELLRGLKLKPAFKPDDFLSYIHIETTPCTLSQDVLDEKKFNLILHPSSNGNGREWPLDYYQTLIQRLPLDKVNVLVTGGPNDAAIANKIAEVDARVSCLAGKTSLDELLNIMQQADGFIAAGTGPLHIAGAMGKRTLGLFPPRKALNHERWRPLGPHGCYLELPALCAKTCSNRDCDCMRALSVKAVLNIIIPWLTEKKATNVHFDKAV